MEKKVLTLSVKKEWFDKIVSNEKKEEYREIKPYWIKRLTTNCEVVYDVVAETYLWKGALPSLHSRPLHQRIWRRQATYREGNHGHNHRQAKERTLPLQVAR